MDSRLRGIADYLLAQPDASTVDPALIAPQLLPHLFILDIERDANVRLRIRLVGTTLDEVFRQPLAGHLLEEFIHGPRGADVIASFHHCARTREPIWMRQIVQMKDREPRVVEGVAVYLVPERIYGGLVVGDFCPPGAEGGFERAILPSARG
jgi:hypothetical protein